MDPERVERRLAAILSADVVGYSRLMAEDEADTVRTLGDYREEIGLLVRQRRGRVVDTAGDSLLAEFPTATDAVSCAVEIQGSLGVRNAALAAERRMEFRIGVHLGEVRAEGSRIYGDGVNIAARLQELAEPGGISISGAVLDQIEGKLDLGCEDLGEQALKNIPKPVRVYRVRPGAVQAEPPPSARTRSRRLRTAGLVAAGVVLLAAVGIALSWPRPLGLLLDMAGLLGPPANPPLPDKPSLVVLPFTNMSDDPAQEYFSDGITEELTSDLARIPELFVIARNSAFVYKDRAVNVEDVGRELGVRYVVEGSVRRAADRVRITAQLIDATTGFHLWSEQYDRDLADVFEVQSEISQEILVALSVEIRDAALERIAHRSTRDLMAYDAFARGMSHYWSFTREGNSEARHLFERAIERDPGFAMARAFLGGTYLTEFASGWNLDAALIERCEEHAQRAIELDPAIPTGHALLTAVHVYRGRLDEAVAAAERAVALGPNVEPPHVMLALASAKQGRLLAALRSLDRAMRLNPRGTSLVWTLAGLVNQAAGRTERAVELLERVRAANSDMIGARIPLAALYEAEGRHAEAREVAREILRVNPHLTARTATELMPLLDPDSAREWADHLHRAGLPD
jgi:adenylate cyclase